MPDFGSPVSRPNKVSSGWGAAREYRDGVHEGLDFPGKTGDPIYAVASGKVVKVDNAGSSNAGKFVAVEHEDGWTTFYMHLSSIGVALNQLVSKGQLLGGMGQTGTKNSGPHLHFHTKVPDTGLYSRLFGTPVTGFGRTDARGTTVPSEPLVPVDVYPAKVVEAARSNLIPLYAATGVSVLGAVVVSLGLFFLWREWNSGRSGRSR
jgi:murein DD-endopeptidase MepM/ murein hydrolase activator NlpD